MTELLNVSGTVKNLSLLDYQLNKCSHTKIKSDEKKRALQWLSYFTHPIDLGVQAIAYPLLRLSNPFVTVGVHIANAATTKDHKGHQSGKVLKSTMAIPFKLVGAAIKIGFYEIGQIVKLAFSISGANTFINVARGKKQTDNFFLKRMKLEHKQQKANLANSTKRFIAYMPKIAPYYEIDYLTERAARDKKKADRGFVEKVMAFPEEIQKGAEKMQSWMEGALKKQETAPKFTVHF